MTVDDLRLRDEILQVLYWLKGEGLSDSATTHQVSVLIGCTKKDVERVLAQMQTDGLANLRARGEVIELTEFGSKEGGRRFGDAFADLTHAAHGACEPDCEDCLVNGPEYCSAHRHDHQH